MGMITVDKNLTCSFPIFRKFSEKQTRWGKRKRGGNDLVQSDPYCTYLVVLDVAEFVDRHCNDFYGLLHHLLRHICALVQDHIVRTGTARSNREDGRVRR